MKKFLFVALLLVIALCLVISCKQPEPATKPRLKSLDLTGAKSFMVVPTTNQGSKDLSDDELVLCKMKADGSVEEVSAQSDSGESYKYVPRQIFDAGDYFITRDSEFNVYLISKSTGTAYDMTEIGVPSVLRNNLGDSGDGRYEGRKSIYLDAGKNIYFVSNGRVVRINATDPERVVLKYLTPEQYRISEVSEFCVNSNGDVLFSAPAPNSPLSGDSLYLYEAGPGSLRKIADRCRCLSFTGYDGEIYFQYIEPGEEGYQEDTKTLMKLTVNSPEAPTFTPVGTTGLTTWYSGGYQWLYLANMIIVLGNANGQCAGVESIVYDGNTHNVSYSTPDYLSGSIVDVVADVDRYFVAKSDGSIIKVDPINNVTTTLLAAGAYDIGRLSPSVDYLAFSGVRFSDGKTVLASIRVSDGNLTIQNDHLDGDIIVLQKVEL